jgi:hypothetical protein
VVILSNKLVLLGGEPTHWCPGCQGLHRINVTKHNSCGAIWTWNNDPNVPVFSPSINIVGRCHYFIRASSNLAEVSAITEDSGVVGASFSVIAYCADTRHELAGQTVLLPNIPQSILRQDAWDAIR